ncbi:MAG TPA: hypothetical protein VN326_10220 [Casimicrobiaceae bacterium]|jgi:hypothetical protein|nr:hypothetical protein [Casimicrobiaceae bacterium]
MIIKIAENGGCVGRGISGLLAPTLVSGQFEQFSECDTDRTAEEIINDRVGDRRRDYECPFAHGSGT